MDDTIWGMYRMRPTQPAIATVVEAEVVAILGRALLRPSQTSFWEWQMWWPFWEGHISRIAKLPLEVSF